MRPLTTQEDLNCQFLSQKNIDYVLLQVTATGIEKEIFDATKEIRNYLVSNGIHDYSTQQYEGSGGVSHKVLCPSYFIVADNGNQLIKKPTSSVFYRSQTKGGAFTRMYVYRIKVFTSPFEKYALIASKDRELYYINISKIDIANFAQSSVYNPIRELVETYPYTKQQVAALLYNRLYALKGQWIPSASINANNAVGYAIEAALQIPRNASNNPDFMGIEIKSHRTSSSRQGDLFSLKPNWGKSNYQSGRQIATDYGKFDKAVGHHYLETTFQINTIAPCGLTFVFSRKSSPESSFVELIEAVPSNTRGIRKVKSIARWYLIDLYDSLLLKHPQTFWITADSRFNPQTNSEEFLIREIEYTKDPNLAAFDSLMANGGIKLDVSVYRRSGRGDTYKFTVKRTLRGQLLNAVSSWSF